MDKGDIMEIGKYDDSKHIDTAVVGITSFHDYNHLFITFEDVCDDTVISLNLGGTSFNLVYKDFRKALSLLNKKYKGDQASQVDECVVSVKSLFSDPVYFALGLNFGETGKDKYICITGASQQITLQYSLFKKAVKTAKEQFDALRKDT